MSRGFVDKVLTFMGVQEEEEVLETFEEEPVPRQESRAAQPDGVARQAQRGQKAQGAKLVSLPSGASSARPGVSSSLRVTVVEPKSYEEVQQIADYLKERRAVIISLEQVERELSKRIVDFISGTTYALDGTMQRIGEAIFLCAPSNVAIEGSLTTTWRDRGIFA